MEIQQKELQETHFESDTLQEDDIEKISIDNSIQSESNLEDVNTHELLNKANDIRLDGRESIFLAASLEDSVMELLILRSCNKNLRTFRRDELEPVDIGNIIAKMNSDREFITKTIVKVYLDLKFNQKYATLNMQLGDIAGKAYQCIAQELRYNDNCRKLKKLRRHQKKEMQINKSLLFNCDLQIYNLRDEIDNDVWSCEVKQRYIDAHQAARAEEHSAKVNRKENHCNDSIADVKFKIDSEIKVNVEIESFTRQTTKEICDKTESWTIKYREESTQLDAETLKLEGMREIQMQKITALQRTLSQHLCEMESWKAVVCERERRLQRERLLQSSAVRLQAWWRGLLVRRRLAAKLQRARDSKRKSAKNK